MKTYIFFSLIMLKYALAAHQDPKDDKNKPDELTELSSEMDNLNFTSENHKNTDSLKRRYDGPDNYQSYLDIVDKEKDFIKLPLDDIKAIFNNPDFTTDSEESVFTLMMMWLKAKVQELYDKDLYGNDSNINDEEKLCIINTYLKPILNLIDFNRMSRFYLGYQVNSYLKVYGKKGDEIYENLITNKEKKSFITRKYDDYPRFSVQMTFERINTWQKKEKYYSQKTLIKGLYYYVFLTSTPDNGLAVYIRCMGEDNNKKNGLPVNILFKVINDERKIIRTFDNINVVFNNYDRSMGLKLTKHETFEDVINGHTSLTKDNILSIIVSIKLLDKIPLSNNIKEFPLGYTYDINAQNNINTISPKLMRAILERRLYSLNKDDLLAIIEAWMKSPHLIALDNETSPLIALDDDIKFCQSFARDLEEKASPLPHDNIRELYLEWMHIKNDPQSIINNPQQGDYDIILFTDRLIALLTSPDFATDSEESIIYIVLDYIKYVLGKLNNPKCLPNITELLESIKWDHADSLYIIYSKPIIENIKNISLTEHYDKEIQKREKINDILITPTEDVNEYYRKLEEIKNNLMRENERAKIPLPDQVSFKAVFNGISRFNKNDSYASSPIMAHGYQFYYFLQAKPDEQGKYYLAGFLKVNRDLANKLYVPITYSITIEYPMDSEGKRERNFSPIKVIFTEPNKAIGGKLNISGEDFDDVIEHHSPIVDPVNDTITVVITLDFKVNPEECIIPQ